MIDGRYYDIHLSLWQSLETAPTTPGHAFRLMQVATIDRDGAPSLRTVVLRHAETPGRMLVFFADLRSKKVEELTKDGRCECLVYDPSERIQARMSGQAVIATSEAVIERYWEKLPNSGRREYATNAAPSKVIVSESDDAINLKSARKHFGVIEIVVRSIDWLKLGDERHERIMFTYGDGVENASRVVP